MVPFMVIEPNCLLLAACFQPLTVLIFIKKINLSGSFAITKRSTDVVTLREERFKNHRIHEKYTHMPTIVSLNGSSRLILFPLLCPGLSNSSTRIHVGRNATTLHTIANTKKETRIQDTRLAQLSLISFRYQQNLWSIFRHSWQLSTVTRTFLSFLVNRWCTNDIKLVKHIRLSQPENRQNCTKRKRARDWTGRGEVLVNEKLNRVSSIARFYGRLLCPNRWIRQLRVGKRKKNTKKKDRNSYTNRHELYSTLDRYILARLNRSSITPLTETTDLLDLPYSHALVIRFFLCISANSHAIYRFCVTGTDRA